ncbi:MAG: tetratricopeptide repeat protein [Planctomycetaceae bacterium]
MKTAYDVSRELNDAERTQLIEETVAQWSDGIGSGSFGNHNLVVLSTSLAMALQNSGQTEIGELFVDAYPMVDDNHVRIEFKECGHSDDELIADLIDDSDAGNVRAMTALGQRYEAGDGVAQDGESAFNLYSRAAEQRDPFAITLLGLCYEVGTGCAKDSAEAKKLYENATDLDFPLAMHCLGEIYEKENPEESVALYRRGASLGDPGCLAELGECLEFGKGVEKNLDEALTCYQRCIEYGFDAVSDAIKRIEDGESR